MSEVLKLVDQRIKMREELIDEELDGGVRNMHQVVLNELTHLRRGLEIQQQSVEGKCAD